jgi:hypothetical protein
MKRFRADVQCQIFATVYVNAENKEEARQKLQQGGGFWVQADFEKHTAEDVEIESEITDLDGDDEVEEEDEN